MKKILAVVALSIVSLGCQGMNGFAEGRAGDPNKYGEFASEVRQAEARAATQTLNTDSLITNHKKITEHLKEQGITKYSLSFDPYTNKFQLQYQNPQPE